MEIEKVLIVDAPASRVWQMLLDPNVMGACVPGMKSIEVLSDVAYVAVVHVKIAFISAKFKLHTKIVEQQAPHYMRVEGTGEDASVASSLKQNSEIFLTAQPDGKTELRIKVSVEVLGRLGTFGLSVMKTKADRMWDEFGQSLVARLEQEPGADARAAPAQPAMKPGTQPASKPPVVAPEPGATSAAQGLSEPGVATGSTGNDEGVASPGAPAATPVPTGDSAVPVTRADLDKGNWWTRLMAGRGASSSASSSVIHIELRRGDTTLVVDWPAEQAQACAAWLRDAVR